MVHMIWSISQSAAYDAEIDTQTANINPALKFLSQSQSFLDFLVQKLNPNSSVSNVVFPLLVQVNCFLLK